MNTVLIEWRHLVDEGITCARCNGTGMALNRVIEQLNRECRANGWQFELTETPLGPDRIGESNLILINGRPIEQALPGAHAGDSHCQSCCDMLGSETHCRTVEFGGIRHEAIPESLIHMALCRAVPCC